MAGVVFAQVRKEFPGGAVAVAGLDLEVRDGEFLSLLGPSGCGKTTTLRMLAGLEHPSAGTIRVGAREVTGLAPSARNIAMVFQSYALYPHMTVAGNIEYPLRKQSLARDERRRLVADTLKMLHLDELAARKPRQLSGGQQQRVALGRAIVRNPEVFLLDEPLSNLDAKLRGQMRAELIQLQRRLGRTMIYVTHDQLEAMTMSHRIAILDRGELQQLGTPSDIYRRPVNRFVAGFVGTPAMNFIAGEIGAGPDGPSFVSADLAVGLPPDHEARPSAGAGRKVIAGIRPEDVLLAGAGARARIAVIEPTGHESLVNYELGGTTLTGRVGAEIAAKVGDTVTLGLRAANLHLFDQADGRRLGRPT
jgi:multiple sugar transport system ATP-binding protein